MYTSRLFSFHLYPIPWSQFTWGANLGLLTIDTELLKIMATKNTPTQNADELKRWNEGLSTLVAEMRKTTQSKDASAIAARIVALRRSFLGDPTKILNLN